MTSRCRPRPQRQAVAPTPRWWRDASAVFAWGVTLFVVALWVAGGGLTAFGSLGEGVTTSAASPGCVASVLMLLQVLLMARIPFVEQAWGQDELARVHRLVGFTSFNLMVAHIVLTTVGYSAGTDLGVIATFVDQVLHSPGMLLALAGTIALVMVVVTSVKKARAKLRYESWHLLHLYAYLGAGLALPHQLWTGEDFKANVAATVFWWGLYAFALVAVLVYRVGLPLIRSRRHRLVVSAGRRRVADRDVGRHDGSPPRPPARPRRPVLPVALPRRRGLDARQPLLPLGRARRPLAPDHGRGRRCARARASRRCGPGTKVLVEGPYGRLHAGVRTSEKAVLIGAGIGITPLRAILEELPASPDGVVVIYRVGSQSDIVLGDELLDLARAKGGRVVAVVGHRNRERDSWLPVDVAAPQRRRGADGGSSPTSPSATSTCAATPPGWTPSSPPPTRPGCPHDAVHHERFAY